MMISSTLLSIMIHSSFLQRGNIIESDNTLGFVDFDSRVLFGEELPDLTYTATYKLHTKIFEENGKLQERCKGGFHNKEYLHGPREGGTEDLLDRMDNKTNEQVWGHRQKSNRDNVTSRGKLR